MNTTLLEPRKALNKAFLKIKPNRTHIEGFKTNLIKILDSINEKESEEFHKNLIIDFLKKTYYDPNYSVNTKGRNDLVIHNGKDAKSNVGVIIEAKSPINKTEMITVTNLNGKALQELVLYYMRERITHKNTELKHLVVTNIHEWFVFDAQLFNKLFAENKPFTKQFIDFEEGRLSGKTTDYFYKEIAKPFIVGLQNEVLFAHFDIRKYDKPLRNEDKEDDKKLVALFKLLSPEHLLKLSFANDSNSLDNNFYSELLHIIGLTEVKEGGKKLIGRHKPENRNFGSLLENTILQLDSLDKISRLQNAKQYGETYDEKIFNVALELTITWVNRILFLKLLEAQLITYHKGDKSYSFLSSKLINDYDNLNGLFFQVLAKKPNERNAGVVSKFEKVPYLNSSLFEPTDLEHETFFISQLEDHVHLNLLTATVIKDATGTRKKGTIDSLNYFFSFLDAYDFASEGSEDIQEDNKTLINASVLGLIFEKINGYKDGSFFTPSFITMYMCKETIRRAVVQKFNEVKNWECTDFDQLYDKIEDKKEANDIINSLKVCDPAVGSGHFLVSALNEIIAIKNDLRTLQDHNGNRLKEYQFEVINDELMVTDEDGIPFQYNPKNKESQRIQETLFHEKQTIIENCLFGVDINPNSVKICRLRLWIELLKNAYYKPNTNELETLPNIDINIKCGNSLISRFELDADLKKALKQSKWNIESYKLAVETYRNAESKEQKWEMERLITDIKGNFRSEIGINDPKKLKLEKLKGELFNYTQQVGLFEKTKKEHTVWNKKVNVLSADIKTLDTEIEEIKSNKIYENAFEWRFEFPDVLNDKGDFVGFDVVIGNPPYVNFRDINSQEQKKKLLDTYLVSEYQSDLFILFIELSYKLLNFTGDFGFIIPNSIANNLNNSKVREYILKNSKIKSIVNTPIGVFPDATVDTVVLITSFDKLNDEKLAVYQAINQNLNFLSLINQTDFERNDNYYFDFLNTAESKQIFMKIETNSIILNSICDSSSGIKEYETGKGKPAQTTNDRINKIFNSDFKIDSLYKKHITGSDVGNYIINWKGGFLKYGEWIAAPRDSKYFKNERIIIREIPNKGRLVVAFTDGDYTVKNTAHIFIPHNSYSSRYLVAILNSKLIGYYFSHKFSEHDKVFPKAKLGQCRLLPIKENSLENQQPFIDRVNEILSIKAQDSQADIKDLEKEIDTIVYELYGLSPEEIKVVEGS
jgi:adenine-specific DNA-methyltransferase